MQRFEFTRREGETLDNATKVVVEDVSEDGNRSVTVAIYGWAVDSRAEGQ